MTDDGMRAAIDTLRREFDESFTRPVDDAEEAEVELLLVRAGASLQAVLVEELRGVRRCPPMTPVPSRTGMVEGLVGIRGKLVPVFPLALLLGTPSGHASADWLLLCGADPMVGLRFDKLDGYARVSASQLDDVDQTEPAAEHRIGVYQGAGEACDILSVAQLIDKLIFSREGGPQ